MQASLILLLHVGHAKNEIEVVLTVLGFVFTLLGLGVAAMSFWPRPRLGARKERARRVVRRRELRQSEDQLLHEDVDGGA